MSVEPYLSYTGRCTTAWACLGLEQSTTAPPTGVGSTTAHPHVEQEHYGCIHLEWGE